ncbi:MAG: LysR family D-serine deaminase transcriptional activator, partial [Marinobacter maritimus]
NHAEMAISATRNAIERIALIQPYLDSGELIATFARVPARMNYPLICPKGMETWPKFKVFTRWLHSQYA